VTVSSPFEVLDIDPDADEDEIERAYRERVKETHPDHGGSAAAFRLVRSAYEELTTGDRTATDEALGDDSDRTAPEAGAAPAETDDEPDPGPSVEYLNYEALGDLGLDLGDEDLFERASTTDLDPSDYGQFSAEEDESLLDSAEECG
jgi:curved DNA-binding protein CbpA